MGAYTVGIACNCQISHDSRGFLLARGSVTAFFACLPQVKCTLLHCFVFQWDPFIPANGPVFSSGFSWARVVLLGVFIGLTGGVHRPGLVGRGITRPSPPIKLVRTWWGILSFSPPISQSGFCIIFFMFFNLLLTNTYTTKDKIYSGRIGPSFRLSIT